MTTQRRPIEERILNAAVHLFAREGFHGTSTRDIAHLAKVNEATLFRYFPRKRDLFWSAIESRLERVRMDRDLRQVLTSDETPATVVPRIVEFLFGIVIADSDLTRLIRFSAVESIALPDRTFRKHFAPVFDDISEYMRRSAAKRVILDADPWILTLGLISTILVHHSYAQVLTGVPLEYETVETAIGMYSNFWLQMLCPATLSSGRHVSTTAFQG
jgi:AcrR family transcriptional regulator